METKINEKVLVIASGGQDSATCLYYAKKRYREVVAVNFLYGQRHQNEFDYCLQLAKDAEVELKIIDLTNLFANTKSALLGNSSEALSNLRADGLPVSFVPNRNATFLVVAHSIAQSSGCSTIITGVCQTDYSGYPDCRDAFIKLLANALNIGSGTNILIETPLMFKTKAETFQMAHDLGCLDKIIRNTLTCYEGVEVQNSWGRGCGVCPACHIREAGYHKYLTQASNETAR